MVAKKDFNDQMKKLKYDFRLFGRAEMRELRKILQPGEVVHHCVYGYYHGGSGLLVATDGRLLLIDKRPFYISLVEISYNRIRDVDFRHKFMQATLFIRAGSKVVSFRSLSDARLRKISELVDARKTFNHQKITRTNNLFKPYLNPGWRPHHTSLLPRRRTTKYHSKPSSLITQ